MRKAAHGSSCSIDTMRWGKATHVVWKTEPRLNPETPSGVTALRCMEAPSVRQGCASWTSVVGSAVVLHFLYPAALLLQGRFQKAFMTVARTAASHSAAHSAMLLVRKLQGEPAVHQLMLKQVS